MDDRARITVPDIVMTVAVIAILGMLFPVFSAGLSSNLGQMDTSTVLMFRIMLPLAIMVLLGRLFQKATVGGGQR